ncbi:MAG TPA: type I methionyl aminopeptidase [Thermoflexales bacterium]|nr:type I methionyl aminopeptidase [Thermoflexales bacterium]HQZ99469.1 type I methionyl aminopeptidase [Thermoflexales bacterium]
MIVLKAPAEIVLMRESGRIVALVLAELKARVKPGVTLLELDALAESIIIAEGGTASFKNYRPESAPFPFPATICASLNDEIVHGIPTSRKLREGDIIKIDVGVKKNGYHADSAISVPVGKVSAEAEKLMRVTQECLAEAIKVARAGNRLGDLGHAIQKTAESQRFSVVREYTSHGVGRDLHEGFSMMNVGEPGQGMLLRPGLTIAVEPMINAGRPETKVKKDQWTVATIDGKISAHFEHTIAITDGEPEILTK